MMRGSLQNHHSKGHSALMTYAGVDVVDAAAAQERRQFIHRPQPPVQEPQLLPGPSVQADPKRLAEGLPQRPAPGQPFREPLAVTGQEVGGLLLVEDPPGSFFPEPGEQMFPPRSRAEIGSKAGNQSGISWSGRSGVFSGYSTGNADSFLILRVDVTPCTECGTNTFVVMCFRYLSTKTAQWLEERANGSA